MAFEDEYGSYRGVIAAALRVLRPHVEVASAGLEGLEQEVARFDPQLVVCSRSKTALQSSPLAWIKLSTDGVSDPNEVWIGDRRWEANEPTIEMLLSIIDRAERELNRTKDSGDQQERPRDAEVESAVLPDDSRL